MASPSFQRFCAAALLLASLLLLQFAWLCTAPSNAEGNALTTVKSMLRDPLGRLSSWNPDLVDPCSSWQGVTCINKRVVSVNLPMFGLSGTLSSAIAVLAELQTLVLQDNNITGFLPSELGNLTNLATLKLQNNSFIGPIPSTLGNLTQLKTLDLSSNNLTGQIPVALFNVSTYNFSGNNLDCGPNQTHQCQSSSISPSPNNSTSTSKALIGTLAGAAIAIVLAVIAGILLCVCCRRNKDVFVDVPAEDDFKIAFGQLRKFSWRELQIATNNFSDEIGAGAFAKVYKGVLNDGTEIAVKRLLSTLAQDAGEASFLQEIEMISVAVHRNLLHLIGFCITPLERILVYPYMPNKSLASRLRARQKGEPGLDWNARKKISLGAARGLEYLHHHCNPKIIHRDVKAANVFLNKDYEAVVGDFGLAKLIDPMNTHVTTVVAGTMGHIAPEYLSTGKSSEKTDVFGYGVMLLELVTGQRAIDFSRLEEEDDVLLLDHVKKLQHEKRLDMIVDPDLAEYDVKEVEQMIQVALLCSQPTPEERPNMAEVVRMLSGEGLAERWEEWQQVEVIRRQEYDAMPQRLAEWVEDSSVNQEAVQLSSAR